MDRRIITYGGYFERFMKELTQKEQQKIKYGLLLLKSQEKDLYQIRQIHTRWHI